MDNLFSTSNGRAILICSTELLYLACKEDIGDHWKQNYAHVRDILSALFELPLEKFPANLQNHALQKAIKEAYANFVIPDDWKTLHHRIAFVNYWDLFPILSLMFGDHYVDGLSFEFLKAARIKHFLNEKNFCPRCSIPLFSSRFWEGNENDSTSSIGVKLECPSCMISGAFPTGEISSGSVWLPNSTSLETSTLMTTAKNSKKVFVIHGRNSLARRALFTFLRSIGLEPIEWSQARAMTGNPSPYIGDILDSAFQEAAAFVVLLTGDDDARLSKVFWTEHEEEYEMKFAPQARANVLFEAGMAYAKHPEQTVFLQLGRVRPFSDISGRHLVKMFSDSPEHRQEIAQRLRDAGCDVILDGSDWYSSGDFESAININTKKKSGQE